MKIFSKIFATATAILLAVIVSSSLLAQEEGAEPTKQYYATVEVEGEDTILYIRGYEAKPEVKDNVIFVQNEELTTEWSGRDYNLIKEVPESNAPILKQIKRVKLEVDENFKPQSTRYWFRELSSIEEIEGLNNLNTENVTVMQAMFAGCSNLKGLDLSAFKTGKLKNIWYMFKDCSSLEVIDFGSFNTEKIASKNDVGYVFDSCCSLKYIFCNEDANINLTVSREKVFERCTTLVGVRSDGERNQCNGNVDDTETIAKFKKADEGGFFTVKRSDTLEVVGLDDIKKKYEIGDDLDLSGAMLMKRIGFGVDELYEMKLCSLEALVYTAKGFNNKKLGKQTVILIYGDKEISFEVEVEGELKEVSVVSNPSLKEYELPITLDSLKLNGGVIKKVYEKSTEEDFEDSLKMEDCKFEVVSGLEGVKAGENTLVLRFDLGDTTFDWEYKINVVEAAAEDSTGSGDEPGEGGEEGDDDPIVAVEDLVCGGLAFEAWASGGVLNVKAVRSGVLEVFSPRGVLVRRMEVAAGGSLRLALEKGVYVLRMSGEMKKVVVE